MLFYENNECLAQNILSKKLTDGLDGTVQIRQFEWLNFEPMERIEPIDYFYGK